ncbi:UDP-glucose 4-epimerase GalE [Roseicyclus sp.]|uniref:UDP-glucose 4-epimerase GalE n=1 Tax=Roseicyclus sp. TaxID=1914329 RepID=UPI003F6C4060
MSAPAILVTGGAGFIGAHCCKALAAAGFRPVVYDNLSTGHAAHVQWGPAIFADLRDRVALRAAMVHYEIAAVMHFAASAYVGQSVSDPAAYHDNNIGGMIALLDVCRHSRIAAVVFSSSCATYGAVSAVPIREDTPQAPINPYGFTKLVGERMLREQAAAYGLRPAILRYFNAAGADPDGALGEIHRPETHLIPLALMAAAGHGPPLSVLGTDYDTPDGSCIRDYIHVDDLARAHVMALRHLLNGGAPLTLNLGSGRGTSVLEVMAAVKRVTGRTVPHVQAPRRPGDPAALVADPRLAAERLGFVTRHGDIDKIIAHAAPWFGHEVRHAATA